MITTRSRFRGAMLGLAVGDALGTTLEFKRPGTFTPIDDIVGGGPFRLEPGQWTDDTSMSLCLAESLVENDGRLDPADQLRRYVRWYRHGYHSSTGSCFDIGNATRAALERFERTGEVDAGSDDPMSAGNGSIMRLAPVPLAHRGWSIQRAGSSAAESSMTTHRARACMDACRLLGELIAGASFGLSKDELLAPEFFHDGSSGTREIQALVEGSYKHKEPPEIRGTGYVVESLEAALWAFHKSSTFRDGALLAVNLGDDADTTGAVYGQLAGAYYGVEGIPADWLVKLAQRETREIVRLADGLLGVSRRTPTDESFWIEGGKLLAGKYPGAKDAYEARAKLQALRQTGVTLIVDLTHERDRLAPYTDEMDADVTRLSFPVGDLSAPSLEGLVPILDAIDAELARDGLVYLHCRGGCGRTGAVAASWLVKHGWDADRALARFGELSLPVCGRECPEMEAQRALVRRYAGRAALDSSLLARPTSTADGG